MRKNVICFTLCAVLYALCSSAEAQQPKKVPRIGYLSSGNSAIESVRSEGIRLALRERGHIEGQNIATEYRYGGVKLDRFAELAVELVQELRTKHFISGPGSRGEFAFLNANGTAE